MAGAIRPRGGVDKTKLRADDEPNLSKMLDQVKLRDLGSPPFLYDDLRVLTEEGNKRFQTQVYDN
eukprot:4237183-Karenia_brevis.AAC.1